MQNTSLFLGQALVTSKGIKFQDNHYSCERAIRERWFEFAHIFGEWTIQVVYHPNSIERVYIPTEVEMECCRMIILHEYKGSKLENYFRSIQNLKQELRRIHKKRSREKTGLR